MNTQNKILNFNELENKISRFHFFQKKIVFTNGCFDLLHLGHIDYLEKARNEGDLLIVGLNSDSSITKLKGPNRPINNELTRSRILASLIFVDYVIIFEEETPLKLIELINPNILIKGNDYDVEKIVGYDFVTQNGGKVKTIELVEGYSSTNIINKIKK